MAIFRVEKTSDFTVMSNHHLKNNQLSLKAKGLLSFMLSCPDDWDYTVKGLESYCKDGRDGIIAAIKELEEQGYVVRQRTRNKLGQLKTVEYIIFENPELQNLSGEPITEKPSLESEPNTDLPISAFPISENPSQLNTKYNKILNIQNTNSCSEQGSEQPVITLTLNNGNEYPVSKEYFNKLSKKYGNTYVTVELEKMRIWCLKNPNKRKTEKGMPRFIVGWLKRGQNDEKTHDLGRTYRSANPVYAEEGEPDNDWNNFTMER